MTKAEREFQDAVRRIGCVVCLKTMDIRSDCEIDHMLDGGRRMGEMFVLGLCPSHHRGGLDNKQITSRDHNKRRFEARYGSEQSLLDWTRVKVEELRACQV